MVEETTHLPGCRKGEVAPGGKWQDGSETPKYLKNTKVHLNSQDGSELGCSMEVNAAAYGGAVAMQLPPIDLEPLRSGL